MPHLRLPTATGGLEDYTLGPAAAYVAPTTPFNRVDWDATLALRHRIWDLGLGVAEAMDTAQRGMGLSVMRAMELNRRSLREAKSRGDKPILYCGIGTDALPDGVPATLDQIVDAYLQQAEMIEAEGGRVVIMASRALVRAAKGPDDYAYVYDRVIAKLSQPTIIHWLGEMFDPALQGYWGAADHYEAMDVCLDVLTRHAPKIAGVKLSLLDREKEIALRARLPAGVAMFTGDDFNYVELIEGDGTLASDALLGAFDMLAPAAAAALAHLANDDVQQWRSILKPTEALARHVFHPPTRFYKTGVVFLAWLQGWQPHPIMLGGQESARSIQHLAEAFRLADACHLFPDPDFAAMRMRSLLAVQGIDQ